MAIQQSISENLSKHGIKFDDAYFRIVNVSVSRQIKMPKFQVTIDLAAYATHSPTSDTREVLMTRYDVDLEVLNQTSGSTFLDKCYTWVMAQSNMGNSKAV